MNRKTEPRQERLQELRTAQEKLARWETEQSTAEAELESLQERAGAEVLDAPDAATGVARSMQQLRDRVDIAGRAVAAMGPRVAEAESVYLLAEADHSDRADEKAQAALDRHNVRTQELLGQLAEHEGAFVPEHELIEEQWSHRPQGGEVRELARPKSAVLEETLEKARRPGIILRAMAAGEDPTPIVQQWGGSFHSIDPAEVYPACVWGPEAVVPAPAYVRAVAATRARLEALDRELVELPGKIADLEAEQAERPHARVVGRTNLKRRADEAPTELEQARSALAALTGDQIPGTTAANNATDAAANSNDQLPTTA